MNYLTPTLWKKLKNGVKLWKKYGSIHPLQYGTYEQGVFSNKSIVTPIYDDRYAFEKDELRYLEESGFIVKVSEKDAKTLENNWAILIEPTYLGIHYPRVAIIHILLELKWIIPLIISIISLVIK